jgi:hypothetical protein
VQRALAPALRRRILALSVQNSLTANNLEVCDVDR